MLQPDSMSSLEVAAAPPDQAALQAVVDRRESTGLAWSIMARVTFLVIGVASTVVIDMRWQYRVFELFVFAVGFLLAFKGLREVKKVRRLALVSRVLAGFDLFVIAALPLSWYASVGWTEANPAFLLKNELYLVSMVLIVINGLSLRPLYPNIVGQGAAVVHLALLGYAVWDGRVVFTTSPLEMFTTASVNLPIYMIRVVTLPMTGWFLAVLAWGARRTLREAVEAQMAETEARRRQAETIMQGRMEAVTGLVAGIAHEINSPLGAIVSSASTQSRVVQRMRGQFGDSALVDAVDGTTRTIAGAGTRISDIVDRLREFARLDQSDVLEAKIPAEIERVIALVPEQKRGEVEVRIRAPSDLPPLRFRVRTINQVLHTIIQNAFEALEGRGRLGVEVRPNGEGLLIRISDNGPGIDRELLPQLFEPRLQQRPGRVGMGLGLPAAKRSVEAQGGWIRVDSQLGEGTTFEVFLPPVDETSDTSEPRPVPNRGTTSSADKDPALS